MKHVYFVCLGAVFSIFVKVACTPSRVESTLGPTNSLVISNQSLHMVEVYRDDKAWDVGIQFGKSAYPAHIEPGESVTFTNCSTDDSQQTVKVRLQSLRRTGGGCTTSYVVAATCTWEVTLGTDSPHR